MKISDWGLFNAVIRYPLIEQFCIEETGEGDTNVSVERYVNEVVLHMGDMNLAQKVQMLIREFLMNVFPSTVDHPDSAQSVIEITDLMETSFDQCSVSIPYDLLYLLKGASVARPDLFRIPSVPSETDEFVSEDLIPGYLSIDSRGVRVEPAFSGLSLSPDIDAGVVEVDLLGRAALLVPEHIERMDKTPQVKVVDSGFQRFLGFMTMPKMQINLRPEGAGFRRLFLT